MAYFSNLKKKMDDDNKKNKNGSKALAITFCVIATLGYFCLFTNLVGFAKHFLLGTFGIFSYVLFSVLYLASGIILKGKKIAVPKKYAFALAFALISILAIFHMAFSSGVSLASYGQYLADIYNMQVSVGGVLLGLLIYPLQKFLNVGAYVLFVIVLIVCCVTVYNEILRKKTQSAIDDQVKISIQNNHSTSNLAQTNSKTQSKKPVANSNTSQAKQNHISFNLDADEQAPSQSVGLVADVEQKSSKQIAMEKLGLVGRNQTQTHIVDDQLDTFNKHYKNAGGTVFSTTSAPNINGTFGYSTILSDKNSKRNLSDEEKYNEYRKFMGLPVQSQSAQANFQQSANDEPYDEQTAQYDFSSSNYSSKIEMPASDVFQSHGTTEANDEILFGAPKVQQSEQQQIQQPEAERQDKNLKFDYPSPSEKSFMDKLTSQQNEEVVPDFDVPSQSQPENNLQQIFESTVPKKEIDLPKSFQNDSYYSTKKFDVSSKNMIDNQITGMRGQKYGAGADAPRQKIEKYNYTKPTLDLLTTTSTDPSLYGGNVEETSHKIEEVLEEFKIPAKVIGITRGPAVTRYELEMPVGISVSKIPALSSDISMRIATSKKIRIQAPIPGMSAFGIEVPNDKVATVSLKEVLSSQEFILSKSPCSFGLGKELNGKIDICAVNKMPHVLIAGSTGSGKSVCLNSLILSILYKSSPEDVKFILIDPKRVEFSIYSGLPHLITPDIISEPKKADNALAWAVKEMEKRYDVLAEHRVRNIDEYNNMQDVKDRYLPKMPYIIIIMDEFADIMQSPDCKDIENKVSKLAAKARAAGIHLVLATQRPSVDVLSGTAKNNFTARIAFFLTSQTDSRTILGYGGAEDLLGKGDMLYDAPGSSEGAKRLQGCYVSDDEVKNVVEYVINNNEPEFDEAIEREINKTKPADTVNSDGSYTNSYGDDDEESEMQAYAKEVMKEFIRIGKASASYIQRTQRVGFAKAGRIIDYLERKKYISASDGTAKPRTVYMTREQYVEIFGQTDFDNHD